MITWTLLALWLGLSPVQAAVSTDLTSQIAGISLSGTGDCPYGHSRLTARSLTVRLANGEKVTFATPRTERSAVWSDTDGAVWVLGAHRFVVGLGKLVEETECPSLGEIAVEPATPNRIALTRHSSSLCVPHADLVAGIEWEKAVTTTLTITADSQSVQLSTTNARRFSHLRDCRAE